MARKKETPVLTQGLIDGWPETDRRRRVRVSQEPDVFGPNMAGDRDVRVWRKGLPPQVEEFTRVALQVFGKDGEAVERLHKFFKKYGRVILKDGKLTGLGSTGPEEILDTSIAELFVDPKIDRVLALAFARHLVDSLEQALGQLSERNYLTLDEKFFNFKRGEYPPPSEGEKWLPFHRDKTDQLLLHYSDPGTVYSFDGEKPAFKTTAGDVTMHGTGVWHAVPMAPTMGGKNRQRLVLSFYIN
jgi:hypothetical protein